ncbi:MAG: CRTAC1 family protein [Verrucomicrobiia bacterium]
MGKPLNIGPLKPRPRSVRWVILRRLLFVAAGCGLVIVWLLHGYDRERSRREAGLEALPVLTSSTQEHAVLRRSVALEDQRREIDQVVWSRELLAEKHGDVVVAVWDNLRRAEDKYRVLSELEFDSLSLPGAVTNVPSENGIAITRFGGASSRLSRSDWRALLRSFQDQGYQLVQSELRHTRFVPPDPGPAESTVRFDFHIANSAQEERLIVRGEAVVGWRSQLTEDSGPVAEHIGISSLEVLRRSGPPVFQTDLVTTISTNSTGLPDPLIVYDLDADGDSEIVLPRQNLVFWADGTAPFRTGTLCVHPEGVIQAAILADFTRDGLPDLLVADRDGLLLFAGGSRGSFPDPGRRIHFTTAGLLNTSVLTAGDIDADGDLDVWLGQFKPPYVDGQMPTPFYDANDGYPSFLIVNEGQGRFRDATAGAGLALKRFRRTSSASLVDLDNDGDLDLAVVSHFAGVDIYYNDGQGRFTDVTSARLAEPRAFGKGHVFADFDEDGGLDIFVAGVWSHAAQRLETLGLEVAVPQEVREMRTRMASGNGLFFERGGVWQRTPVSEQVASSGWSSGVTRFDFDNDGDLELYIANGNRTRESVKEDGSQFWRHDIHVAQSTPDPAVDSYFQTVKGRSEDAGWSRHGYEKNRLFLSQGGLSFLEAGFLFGVALEEDCRAVASGDLDGDGRLDLVVSTQETWPEPRQTVRVLRNGLESPNNWIGFQLRDAPSRAPVIGAKIRIWTPSGQQSRQILLGESFRTQHPNTAHFGLGTETSVQKVEVKWPNGTVQHMEGLPINRYHVLVAEPGGG